MSKMASIFLAGYLLLNLTPYVQAQGLGRSVVKTPKTIPNALSKSTRELTDRLLRRVHTTYWQTTAAQQQIPITRIKELPWIQTDRPLRVDPQSLYPHVDFLDTPEQLTAYFLAKNNLEIQKWLQGIDKYKQFLQQHVRDIQKVQPFISHPTSQDMAWSVDQIPLDTDYLLIGEMHNHPAIQNHVATFIQHLRAKFPQRQILLFTEFLSESHFWEMAYLYERQDYLHIWETCDEERIPVKGLELSCVHDETTGAVNVYQNMDLLTAMFPSQMQLKHPIWGSLEGVRLRNRHWMSILAEFRQKYPDALFVVYSGIGHSEYQEPYSLGKQLSDKKTFVVSFLSPEETRKNLFDIFTNHQLKNRILRLEGELAQQVGFNLRVQISDK